MKTIHKYWLQTGVGMTSVQMPSGAKVLRIGDQDDNLYAWALVDTDRELGWQPFVVVGTGWELPSPVDAWVYVGTAQCGVYVWHVFMPAPTTTEGE